MSNAVTSAQRAKREAIWTAIDHLFGMMIALVPLQDEDSLYEKIIDGLLADFQTLMDAYCRTLPGETVH